MPYKTDFNLNAGSEVPPCKRSKDGRHDWVQLPFNDRPITWIKEKCVNCGIIIEYDTSD